MYMAMEYVDGRSLRALMTGKAPIATDLALDVARQVLDALQYLHEEGVVHRDIKPENVLLAPGNRVKILDFGIALFASERRLTWAGFSNTVGTPDYMAPEQIRGRRGDPRTDVYAVGTLLYEMLTCNLPFESANPRALMNAKANDEPRPPSYYVPGFDPSLETIILRAIEREPRARYATARQMLRDVENPSAVAPRDPSAGRSRRRGQRLRRRVIVGVALAAALTGLGWLMRLTYVRTVESGRAPAASQRGR
jgi:serine/threonine-protein kinase